MIPLGCYLRQKAPSSPLSLLSELSSVYPQTSPLVNRLGLSPAVSFFLHLPLPPSPCLMACLFLSEPLPYSCDGIKEREEEEKGAKESGCMWGSLEEMGQVLAVQELLYLPCLHGQAAEMFSSSKTAVGESKMSLFLRLWPDRHWQRSGQLATYQTNIQG